MTLAAQNFVNGGEFQVDMATQSVTLSKIFRWYAPDFGGSWRNVLGFGDFSAVLQVGASYLADPMSQEALLSRPKDFRVSFKAYDWSLNLA